MKIYILEPNLDDYQGIQPKNDDFWDYEAYSFDGEQFLTDTWKELKLETPEEDRDLIEGDLPDFSISYIPVFSQRSFEVLKNVINNFAEFLPAICGEKSFYLLNVKLFGYGLDEEKSDLTRLSTGRILKINQAIFKRGIEYPPIFKLSQMPKGEVFVNEIFKEIVESSGLSGFVFKECC